VRELSKGGQAWVYRAVDPNLDRELIIKLGERPLSAETTDADRIAAEGRILADLHHPHIAHVYDFDVHENRPFLVMEYVRGRTLRQHAEGKQLPPGDGDRPALRGFSEAAR